MNNLILDHMKMRILITNLIHSLHGKFKTAMNQAGYQFNGDFFKHPHTGIQYSYQEAFQYWCGQRMKDTPPPF